MDKMNPKPAGEEPEPKTPSDLKKALTAKPLVEAVWKSLTPLARWDFIIWVDAAKQLETRKRRIEKARSMLTAGKRRPCCFTIVPTDLYKALAANQKAKAVWKGLTPTERRDFVTWIDSVKQSETSRVWAQKACMLLAAGKQRPTGK
ncbi:MAG: YdeI/OmpD-associated family protein [Candidatus Doudnabacteria bacterium]|nr:YdeI/OmpD-associated family protein [Candidatus Doudnabacteria bacterium]